MWSISLFFSISNYLPCLLFFYGKVKFYRLLIGFCMRKAEKVQFSAVAVELFNVEMKLLSTFMNSRGQGHLVTLANGHLG